jgi:hypothetical protein
MRRQPLSVLQPRLRSTSKTCNTDPALLARTASESASEVIRNPPCTRTRRYWAVNNHCQFKLNCVPRQVPPQRCAMLRTLGTFRHPYFWRHLLGADTVGATRLARRTLIAVRLVAHALAFERPILGRRNFQFFVPNVATNLIAKHLDVHLRWRSNCSFQAHGSFQVGTAVFKRSRKIVVKCCPRSRGNDAQSAHHERLEP